ncbi:MAG TPA: dienelactone hydrolase family protein [Acidimicrobiales bacterium]|nr:dienelactone hydrolase family protein [Acidimicrobiales bacterium]
MTVATRIEHVTAPTGDRFDAHAFVPDESGPGVLLLQEIYGVGEFLQAKATLLAGLGYAVLVPDVFWRVERNVSLAHDEEALQIAFGYMGRFSEIPKDVTTGDLVAALRHLRMLPEVRGKVAVLGYCLGGRLAYEVAAAADPDACVAYYGSGIAAELDVADDVKCPVLFHYGGSDPYIPREEIDAVTSVFVGRPGTEVVVQEQAGHAFENSFAPMFSNPEAAAASWPVTLDFLDRTLRA